MIFWIIIFIILALFVLFLSASVKVYFEFKRDGFGPICEDIATTVKTIKEIISKECKMDKQYLDRVKKFYYKMDDKNSERIYNEIIKIK